MAEDYIDELDETLDDLEPVSGTPELYEHFRVVVDKGQSPVRIDKYLFERIRLQMQFCLSCSNVFFQDEQLLLTLDSNLKIFLPHFADLFGL